MDGQSLNKPVVGIAAAPDLHGYWAFASDGGLLNDGTGSVFKGSAGSLHLNKPVVGRRRHLIGARPPDLSALRSAGCP